MEMLLYAYIFIIGITFGSFFTLAVYRIPLRQDITHTRSYCPNCNHKLAFLDMIPVFSYIFLGGKCRYCNKKIRIRYLLLEIFSGIIFVLFAISVRMNFLQIDFDKILYCILGLLYIAGLFILAGIDKERIEINNGVLLYLIIVEALFIIYLYAFNKVNIYKYVIYLLTLIFLIIANNIYFKKNIHNNYTFQVAILAILMTIFTNELCSILTLICTIIFMIFKLIIVSITKIRYRKVKVNSKEKIEMPVGYYLCVSNIIMIIITNVITFYRG